MVGYQGFIPRKKVESVPGFETIKNEWNMDHASYSMTVLCCTVRLGKHHNLSLPELQSVQIAFQVLPHSCMFFGIASKMLLQLEWLQIPATFRTGYGSGYILAGFIVDLFRLTRSAGVPQK